jgi:hypothetical protein
MGTSRRTVHYEILFLGSGWPDGGGGDEVSGGAAHRACAEGLQAWRYMGGKGSDLRAAVLRGLGGASSCIATYEVT